MPPVTWRCCDDTQPGFSIVEIPTQFGRIDQDVLSESFALFYARGPACGHGSGTCPLVAGMARIAGWHMMSRVLIGGRGWYDHGTAMRVAPPGSFFTGDPEKAAEQARLSAEVTHVPLEGITGTRALAVVASFAATPDPPENKKPVARRIAFCAG